MQKYIQSLTILVAIIFIGQSALGQIGIRAKYLSNGLDSDQKEILSFASDDAPFDRAFAIGVDYWFRMKNKRVEFLPEIGFSYTSSSIGDQIKIKYSHNSLFLNFNTRIYPMDFGGDCDCPTFSNQSTLIKKGFYFELSPGLALNSSSNDFMWTDDVGNPVEVESSQFLSYKLGIGTGLDIGISNLLTINPYVMYNYHFNVDYVAANVPSLMIDLSNFYETDQTQLEFGIRFAIRLDAKNY